MTTWITMIITIEEEEKVFWWGDWIVVNVLKFNRN
jgi:hypothetical protein